MYLLLWTLCVNLFLRVFKILRLWGSSGNWILFPYWISVLYRAGLLREWENDWLPSMRKWAAVDRLALDAWVQFPALPFPSVCDLGKSNCLNSLKQWFSNFSTLVKTQECWASPQSISAVGPQIGPGATNTVQDHTLRNATVILSVLIFKVGTIVSPSLDCCRVWRQNLKLTFLPVHVHPTLWSPVCLVQFVC